MWTTQQSRAQYLAIARLRWRMTLNGFRRGKNAASTIVTWIILAPLALAFTLGVSAGAGFLAWYLTHGGHVEHVAWVFWAIFAYTQLVNLQIGQPGTTFDPTQLIRFPLTAGQYTSIRLFFGILTLGNVNVVFCTVAAMAGVLFAQPSLWPWAIVAGILFIAVNTIFSRMIFSWVDRWLATRRAREIFTALIFIGSLGFQWVNFNYNPGYHKHHHHQSQSSNASRDSDAPQSSNASQSSEESQDSDASQDNAASQAVSAAKLHSAQNLYTKAERWLAATPPELTANALADAQHHAPAKALLNLGGDLFYAAAFFAIFGLRMRTEFRGENLSDTANAVARKSPPKRSPAAAHLPARAPTLPQSQHTVSRGILGALFAKELLYLRRNIGLFYGLVAPLVMVLIFANRFAARGTTSHTWIFPAALAYALLGVVPVSFNSFGLDGVGSQVYFFTPVRMRDVLLAKNIFNTAIAAVEILAILILVTYLAGAPSPMLLVSVLLWAIATMFLELTVGNFRSITSPKRIDPANTAKRQAKPINALLSMGILLAASAVGWALLTLSNTVPELAWILPLSMLVFALIAAAIYWHNLNGMDVYAIRHRDAMFEELSRKA